MQLLFHVKICGVTTPADARLAAAAGADAVGFNFVAGSPRRIDTAAAREAVAALPAGVLSVGVFAGTPAGEILEIVRSAGLAAVQLHGHLDGDQSAAVDPPHRCRDLAGLPVIRAVRLGPDGLAAARAWIVVAGSAGRSPEMVIVDAGVAPAAAAGRLGGTGHLVDWEAFAREPPLAVPAALAGGLSPANVGPAIRATGVLAVDTASGVEIAPGHKDPALLRAFVAAAHEAFDQTG
jgi:phosphoribosylanthranilate isomerase